MIIDMKAELGKLARLTPEDLERARAMLRKANSRPGMVTMEAFARQQAALRVVAGPRPPGLGAYLGPIDYCVTR